MRYKKSILTLTIIIFLFTMASVCAGNETLMAEEGHDFGGNDELISVENSNVREGIGEVLTFDDLKSEIDGVEDGGELKLTHDYAYESGSADGIAINKTITINGNDHRIDGAGKSRIFVTYAKGVTLNNLVLANGNASQGGAIYAKDMISCNDMLFQANTSDEGGAAYMKFTINLTGCVFDENHAVTGGAIHLNDTKEILPEDIIDDESDSDEGHDEDYDYEEDPMPTYTISNCIFKNSVAVHGLIYAHIIDTLSIIDSTFEDSSSEEGTAVYKALGGEIEILNSTFINLHAKASGGAVAMIQANALTIENSRFVNVTSHNSGGAIACDVYFEHPDNEGRIKITGSEFANSKSGFGGAIAVAGGKLNVTDCIFNGNLAQHSGGAIYTSQTLVRVSNSTFKGNALDSSKGKGSAISAIFRQVTVDNSRFIDNHDNAVCLLENGYSITNSLFENNTEAIYSTFAESSFLENNTFGNDAISENVTDSTYYVLVVNSTGARMDLIENEIDTENLPEYFNSADWGWVLQSKTSTNPEHAGYLQQPPLLNPPF